MRRLTYGIFAAVLAVGLLACGDTTSTPDPSKPLPPIKPLAPGQTDFTSEGTDGNPSNSMDGEPSRAGGAYAPAPAEDSKSAAPPSGRTGEVEEADIYRVDKDRLFYLNTYRGFVIYDIKDRSAPKRISRLPVYGYPIEMFVKGNTVYALLKDALYLTQEKGKLKFERHNVSQLVSIDISDISKPRVLKTVDIIGQLREGVSRKIEDTIYVVSYIPRHYYWGWGYNNNSSEQKEQAWVYSFNVADPTNLRLVQKLKVFEGGGYANNSQSSSFRRTFSGVSISATSNALMVVENWRVSGWSSSHRYGRCGSYTSLQQAVISIVDISDEKGVIRTHAKFDTYGHLSDQFKQTYFHDEATNKGYYIGIFGRREWSSTDCRGTSFTQNTIESWDVTDGDHPKRIDELAFGKKNETVRGSTFDPDRKVAFAITARQIDPLYALSYKDPANLQILSEIDGLSGDMNVFRLIGGKKFLLGIGRDNSDTCQGFGDPATGWRSTNVAVSVIDVRDLSKIRLVQRQCVAIKNARWVGSALNWNLDQAHKMIGMFTDDRASIITVPVYYYKKSDGNDWWWYERETAVGLMTYDLTRYDDAKDEKSQDVLRNFGTIIHPKGEVRRSIVFRHQAEGRRTVLNLSDTHISVVDIEDLNKPELKSIVEVAPYYGQVYRFGDYIVEQLGQSSYYGSQESKTEFRIKKLGGELEQAKVVAGFSVGQVNRVLKHGNKLVLFRQLRQDGSQSRPYYGYSYKTELLVYDLSIPWRPRAAGSIVLPGQTMPYYRFWCGVDSGYWGGYWFGGNHNWTVVGNGIAFLRSEYDQAAKRSRSYLSYVNLADVDRPAVSETELNNVKDWAFMGLVADGGDRNAMYLNYRVQLERRKVDGYYIYRHKYYAQRWLQKGGKLVGEHAINLPGRLMRAYTAGTGEKRFLSYDQLTQRVPHPKASTDGNYARSFIYKTIFRLNMLRRIDTFGKPAAELLASKNFNSFYLKDMALMGDKMIVNARRDYYYNQLNEISWKNQSDHLMIFDISGRSFDQKYSAPTATYNVQLMGTHNGRLFLSLPGDGVLVVNVDDPTSPYGQKFVRTLGWATHLEFAGNSAFVAAGSFGIYQFEIDAALRL